MMESARLNFNSKILGSLARPQHCPFRTKIICRSQQPGDDLPLREQAKRLDQLFYSKELAHPIESAENIADTDVSQRELGPLPLPGIIEDLPLWRVQWAVLPSAQEVLHVHVPHYCDLFNRLFAGPRPWRFGHLYLPGGSASLGSEEYALRQGSKAPLVGTLMEAIQAVRFPDGRLLILAAGIGRFKVVRTLKTVPHSRADVIFLPDSEELAAAESQALAALDNLAEGDTAITRAMGTADSAAQHASYASAKTWWDYELVHVRVHDKLAVIDSGNDETAAMQFGRRLVNIGSNEVVELPWAEQNNALKSQLHNPVVFDETTALQEAALAAGRSAEIAAEETVEALDKLEEKSWKEVESFLRGRFNGYNSVKERGVNPIAGGSGTSGTASDSTSTTEESTKTSGSSNAAANNASLELCLELEKQVWHEIDAVRALAEKIAGRSPPLAEGLLCLRPEELIPAESEAIEDSETSSSNTTATSAGSISTSENLDKSEWSGRGAHPSYPDLRRVQRFSFALVSSLGDVSASEGRQGWLEINSISQRLQMGLDALRRHRDVLAAVVAVRNLGGNGAGGKDVDSGNDGSSSGGGLSPEE